MKNEKILRICAYCKHACLTRAEEPSLPPLLLTANLFEDDSVTITCRGKKAVAPDFSCRRFCFDPLKYRPKKKPPILALDEDALLLD